MPTGVSRAPVTPPPRHPHRPKNPDVSEPTEVRTDYAHAMAGEPTQMSDEQIELANQLFDFARAGETEKLAAYIDAGAPLEMRNANGDTFLILATYNGAPETVAMLIEKGADLETQNDRGQNALTCAVFKQDVEAATHLLKAGADPDAGIPTARDTAKMFGFTQLDDLL